MGGDPGESPGNSGITLSLTGITIKLIGCVNMPDESARLKSETQAINLAQSVVVIPHI